MSKIIIDEHCCGNLSVKNNKDGATFEIKLPIKI
jgi:nitrogen fixation/metabolism regulation signal transduction histidine kinase